MKWYVIFIFLGLVGCVESGKQEASSGQKAAGSKQKEVHSSQSTVDSSQLVEDREKKTGNRELKTEERESKAQNPKPKMKSQKSKADSPIPTKGWTELNNFIPEIVLDMRYATTNNFVKKVMYPCPRCFVKSQVAEALKKAQKDLNNQHPGYRFKMYDCYRPKPVQQKLWDIVPDPNYVTPPKKGSMHNRGLAVDITIVDKAGNELDMGTEFDFFGPEAHFDYLKHSQEILDNRRLLRRLLEEQGFKGIRTEWWHFSLSISGTEVSDWEWDCDY